MKIDVYKTISNFFEVGLLPININSSFIILILKADKACKVTDFRPISLINSCMKLIIKILALRLNKVLHKLVSSTQSGFIKGRHTSDSILVGSEVVQGLKVGRHKGLVLKIDFGKAFNTIEWGFLFHLLKT